MEIILIIVAGIVGFIGWSAFKSIYRRQESRDKIKITLLLKDGLDLAGAINTVFSKLNDTLPQKLSEETVSAFVRRISSLENRMDPENVIEIYSTFIYRYICRNSLQPHPNVSDANVLYALEHLSLEERNGYFVLKADKDEDFERKYPKKTP